MTINWSNEQLTESAGEWINQIIIPLWLAPQILVCICIKNDLLLIELQWEQTLAKFYLRSKNLQ